MPFLLPSNFDLTGAFEGYSRNEKGKRRMLLRVDGGDVLEFKVPKEIRKDVSARLVPGMKIRVSGEERRKLFRKIKRVVHKLLLLSDSREESSACVKCPIRVCSKKNCWKQGGKEIWKHMEQRIEEKGLAHLVELKKVGCLKNCERAPNAVFNRKRYGRCSKGDVEIMLEEIAARHDAEAEKIGRSR